MKSMKRQTTIQEANLSVRAFNCLRNAGLNPDATAKEVCRHLKSLDNPLKMRNYGAVSHLEVIRWLESEGCDVGKFTARARIMERQRYQRQQRVWKIRKAGERAVDLLRRMFQSPQNSKELHVEALAILRDARVYGFTGENGNGER